MIHKVRSQPPQLEEIPAAFFSLPASTDKFLNPSVLGYQPHLPKLRSELRF
ncbi:MAG: hypothetical protein RMX98_002285 [Nostoc sp. DedQUE02]|nr:hypothetical protein [Nostoc sp. DedQUE02]